jgi:hypothetical protein
LAPLRSTKPLTRSNALRKFVGPMFRRRHSFHASLPFSTCATIWSFATSCTPYGLATESSTRHSPGASRRALPSASATSACTNLCEYVKRSGVDSTTGHHGPSQLDRRPSTSSGRSHRPGAAAAHTQNEKPPGGHSRRFRRFNVSSVASPWRPRGNQGIELATLRSY